MNPELWCLKRVSNPLWLKKNTRQHRFPSATLLLSFHTQLLNAAPEAGLWLLRTLEHKVRVDPVIKNTEEEGHTMKISLCFSFTLCVANYLQIVKKTCYCMIYRLYIYFWVLIYFCYVCFLVTFSVKPKSFQNLDSALETMLVLDFSARSGCLMWCCDRSVPVPFHSTSSFCRTLLVLS